MVHHLVIHLGLLRRRRRHHHSVIAYIARVLSGGEEGSLLLPLPLSRGITSLLLMKKCNQHSHHLPLEAAKEGKGLIQLAVAAALKEGRMELQGFKLKAMKQQEQDV